MINTNNYSLTGIVIAKLEGVKNWNKWKADIKTIASVQQLSDMFLLKEVPNFTEEQAEKKKEYLEKNNKLWALIYLQVSNGIQEELIEENGGELDGLKAWIYLENTYGKLNVIDVMTVKNKLEKLTLQEGGDMDEYIKQVRALLTQLKDGEQKLSDKEIIVTILRGLPDSYKSFVMAKATTTQSANQFMKELSELARANLLITRSKEPQAKDEAYFTKKPQYRRPQSSGYYKQTSGMNSNPRYKDQKPMRENYQNKQVQCYNCKKFGHKQYECPYLQNN